MTATEREIEIRTDALFQIEEARTERDKFRRQWAEQTVAAMNAQRNADAAVAGLEDVTERWLTAESESDRYRRMIRRLAGIEPCPWCKARPSGGSPHQTDCPITQAEAER